MKFIERHGFSFLILTGILIGAFLRLYHIGSQIIWDDEWHGIYTALFNPLRYIFTHFHCDDNCIPLTIYYRIMLEFAGLNEIIIRLPQLLSGILMLVLFPLIVKRLFNRRVAVIFLFMLAISPLLIYFSRLARPYSIVVFLSFISIVSFYLWMTEKRKAYVLIYLPTAVLAPYFSLSSLAFVLAPILYVIILTLFRKRPSFIGVRDNIPPVGHILFVILALIAGIASWLLPAVGSLSQITNKSGQGFVDLGTLGGCLTLFSGSKSYIICLILLVLFVYGLRVLYIANKLLFSYLCTISLSQLLYIVLSRPFLTQNSIIFARYFLSSLPVWLLIISISLNELYIKLTLFLQDKTRMANAFSNLTLVVLLLIIFLKGPVTDVYSFPNDFTNHKDFQYNYLYLDSILDRASNHEGLYPEFYLELKNQVRNVTIIEFPAIVSWTWNIFHVYQRFHESRVKIGYDSNDFGPFFGYDTFGNKTVGFRNFVDISNPKLLVGSGADFIVLHKNIWKESVVVGLHSPENKRKMESRLSVLSVSLREGVQEYVSRAIVNLKRVFGEPFYQDDWIVVYKIK